jgi:hypothetical protein
VFTTQQNYCAAAGCCIETVGRRLKSIAYSPGPPYGTRHYPLAQAVTTLRPREIEKGAVERLVATATVSDDSLYVGSSDALDVACNLIEWLPDNMRTRAVAAQNNFISGVANSRLCTPAVVENLGTLQALVILQPDVLRHVLTAMPADIERIAPAFALVNNSANMIKEAA